MLPVRIKNWFSDLLKPIGVVCSKIGIHPHVLTTLGFVISIGAGLCFGTGLFRWAGMLVLVSGIFDMLDGHTARISGKQSLFGALYDSTLDRYAELAVFIGLTVYYLGHPHPLVVVVILLAVSGSMMVSYVRARAEGLKMTCSVGLMQRPERIVYLGFGALIFGGTIPFQIIIGIIAIFTHITAIQRLRHIFVMQK
jgi:CDP-diacylglycerol--glycerol-3-phosphate 3-phosphatidyltransferase